MAHKATIEVVGLGSEDWTTEEDQKWERYGTIEIRANGVTYEVGAVVGVPEYLRGTAKAAGGDMVRPYLDVWFADASDYLSAPGGDGSIGVDPELFDELQSALRSAARRLWDEWEGVTGVRDTGIT